MAKVKLHHSDTFRLTYKLHDKEQIQRSEVKQDTLYFNTTVSPVWAPQSGDWSLDIFVPEHISFDHISIKSVTGNIELDNFDFQTGDFETTTGAINLQNIHAQQLEAESVTGNIRLTRADVARKTELETDTGKIKAELKDYNSLKLSSVGKISISGVKQSSPFNSGQGEPRIEASSATGAIEISKE